MSFPNFCGCSDQAPVTYCECVDPGIETSLRHITGLDNKLCNRRLQNAAGFLTATNNGGSGTYTISFTSEPKVPYTIFEVGEGTQFAGLVAAMGDTGIHRRIKPTFAGYVQTDATGNFFLGGAPEATVPDPLTVTTLNAGTANIGAANISGITTLTGLNSDTITQTIGLNGSNQLVKGSSLTAQTAMFYENPTMLSAATPNSSISPGGLLTIGNEIFDSDAIASVVNSQNIRVDKAGLYQIRWMGTARGFNPTAESTVNNFYPDLQLAIGASNAVVNRGQQAWNSPRAGGVMYGEHIAQLAANTGIWLRLGDEARTPSTLQRVQIILTKLS